MELRIVIFQGNKHGGFSDAAMIRETVFLDEQKFTVDFDDVDGYAWHGVVYDGDIPAATGRFFADAEGIHHIGRVAVQKDYRGKGVGTYLMQQLEAFAKTKGAVQITLGAQMRAADFYQKQGYTPYGEHFYDEYCEHIHMKKNL